MRPRSFANQLPHHLLLDAAAGVQLLATPRPWRPELALGCAWRVIPRNVEACDESVCLDMARQHESLVRGLPAGSALQTLMTVVPSTAMPAWEALRADCSSTALLRSQTQAIREGLPHREGTTQARLRDVHTIVTLRIPVPSTYRSLFTYVSAFLGAPLHAGARLAQMLRTELAAQCDALVGWRQGVESTLRGIGHAVTLLDGEALVAAVAHGIAPLREDPPVVVPGIPVRDQVLASALWNVPGGWVAGETEESMAMSVLSLHRAAPQLYPGILSAPRAPEGAKPLALWDAWPGPMTVAVNLAVIDQATAKSMMTKRQTFAALQARSLQNQQIKEQLDKLITELFLSGGQLLWGRVHVALYGARSTLARGLEDVRRAARRLSLEFVPEPHLGSTLFLQTLPLGFDSAYPKEAVLKRARHLPASNLMDLLPLYGGFRGTKTAAIPYLNQRGEAVSISPFDSDTNPHGLVLATSGAGKTYNMIHLIYHMLTLGASIVVLDRIPSYKEACAEWQGTYLDMDINAPVCFNPFYGPLDKEHAGFIVAVLAEMASGGMERLTRDQQGVLDSAVSHFIDEWVRKRPGEEATLSMFMEALMSGRFAPTERSLRRFTIRLADSLCTRLSPFHGRGTWAGFFDGPNTLVIAEGLTVIETEKLSNAEDVQGILFFCLLHLLTQFFQAPHRLARPKFLIGDETWAVLRLASTAPVIGKIVRTYRRLYTSAIFLSNHVKDFESPVGRLLAALAANKWFLQQDPSELADLKELFKLSEAEMALMGDVRKHEDWSTAYFWQRDGTGGLIRLVPDRYTQMQVGQRLDIRQARDGALQATGGNMPAAMELLLRQAGEVAYG